MRAGALVRSICGIAAFSAITVGRPVVANAASVTASVHIDPARIASQLDVASSARSAEGVAAPRAPEIGIQVVLPRSHVATSVRAQTLRSTPVAGAPVSGGPLAEIRGTGSWCGFTVAFVSITPTYAGSAGTELATDLQLMVESTPGETLPITRQRANAAREMRDRDLLRAHVANPDDVDRFAPPAGRSVREPGGFRPAAFPDLEGSDVDYVIVTSAALAPAFQPLADWKTKRGVPAVVRTIESIQSAYRNGSDVQETIRTFIQDAYTRWGVTWVLLGGDTEIIPARFVVSSFGLTSPEEIPCDLYFAGLDGNWNKDGDFSYGEAAPSGPDPDAADLLAEVYVSRAPVTTPQQVTTFTQKVIAYETPVDPTYQASALFLGEVLFPTNWDTTQAITMDGAQLSEDIISQRVPPHVTVRRRYEDFGSFAQSLPLSRAASLDEIELGYNIVNHIGHGFRYNMSVADASIVNADADVLTNASRLSILNILNCTSLAFDYSCLGEHFMNAPGGGAVAVVGAARSAYPLPSREYQDDWYQLLFSSNVHHLGELFARSRLALTPLATNDSAHRWTHYIYGALGDPELNVFSALPATLAVGHPATVGLGSTAVPITVTAGGQPVQGARVCLQRGVEDYQVAVTDANGEAAMVFAAESPGDIDLTVSGRNLRTVQTTITAAGTPATAYLHLDAATIDDDNAGGTSGNANGVLDAGETVDIRFSVRNDGLGGSGAIAGTVSESSPHVNVLTPGFTAPAAGAGATVLADGSIRLQLLANAPDRHVFELQASLQGGGAPTTDRWKREIHAPKLSLVRLEVLDGASGDGDGTPDAGEIFELRCWIKNEGTGRLDGATTVLQTSNPLVTILQGSSPLGAIAPRAEVAQSVLFQLTEDILDVNWINLRITDTRGRLTIRPFELRPPTAPFFVALDPSTGPTVVRATWPSVSDADLAGYHVYRGPAASGPWTRATVDATRRTAYFRDTGLATNTRYWYAVSSVDSSGNESARSQGFSVSTNPPQLAGWPITMDAETSSSPALGDLDGDGLPEIVQGDAYLYAWHGNGQEIVDADANPQTWGVLSTVTGTIAASVALAEADGSAGLEIFACSWESNAARILDGDGTVLWTRTPANGGTAGYWGTPAAADVDRDGRNEFFAPSRDGRLYAWNHDGSPLIPGNPDGTFALIAPFSRSSPALGNLDADFELEIVEVDAAGNLQAWNHDGSTVPGFPKAYGLAFLNSPVLGDVNGDGRLEIVAIHQSGGQNLHVLRGDGTELPGFPISVTLKSAAISPTPALADLDADGKLEIVIASNEWNPAESKVHVIRWNGTSYPGWPQLTGTDSESSPIVADLDGDHLPDIVHGGQDGVLRAWRRDGVEVLGFPLSVGDFIRATPAVGDVDGDQHVDLVLAGWDGNVYVWDFPGLWYPDVAYWPAYLHDAARTKLYGHVVEDATDSGPDMVDAPPAQLELAPNRPNPFNPSTEIGFGLPAGGARVQLDIYDVRGRLVRGLVDGVFAAGHHRVRWDGRDDHGRGSPSGLYFARLRWQGEERHRRMLLLK